VFRIPPALLAASGQLLTSTLDYDTTLRRVAHLTVPTLADWSMVYVPDDGDTFSARVVLAHANPARESVLQTLWQRRPAELPERHPVSESLRARQPLLLAECGPALLDTLARNPEELRILQRIGVHSLMAVPLVAHDLVIGGLMLARARASRPAYDPMTLEAVSGLARWYAQAIYNAQLFSEAKLAIRLRDELIVAASRDLLALMNGIRRRTENLRWQAASAHASLEQQVTNGMSAIEALTSEMEQLVRELRMIADLQAGR
jgi:GAF domain-containing protein